MKPAAMRPRVQVLVCTHARAPTDPLASGCGAAGPAVFSAMKRAVIASGRAARVWVTATGCMGHCPRVGCSVALHPMNEHHVEVTEADAPALTSRALAASEGGA